MSRQCWQKHVWKLSTSAPVCVLHQTDAGNRRSTELWSLDSTSVTFCVYKQVQRWEYHPGQTVNGHPRFKPLNNYFVFLCSMTHSIFLHFLNYTLTLWWKFTIFAWRCWIHAQESIFHAEWKQPYVLYTNTLKTITKNIQHNHLLSHHWRWWSSINEKWTIPGQN